MSSRIIKKIITPFEISKPTGAILLINLLDPQLSTVKVFLKAIVDNDMHYFAVGNKMDLVDKEQIKKVKEDYKEMMSEGLGGLHEIYYIISTKTAEGIEKFQEAIDEKFDAGERVIILGVFNSGKTSLISHLIEKPLRIGDIAGTTLSFDEYKYKDFILIDTVGQLIDINKPLMFSIDLSECKTIEERINTIFNKEAEGILKTYRVAKQSIIKTVHLLKKQVEKGKKIITVGAGASALVANEIAGQGIETGLPIMVFTNNMSEALPISFSKGLAEDEGAMAKYFVQAINRGDCIIGISASGSTGFVYELLRLGKEKGAKTIAITENPDTPLGKFADIIIKSDAKPEGPSSSLIQTAHLVIGHCIILTLAEERGLTAGQCIKYMLPEKCETKKMGIK